MQVPTLIEARDLVKIYGDHGRKRRRMFGFGKRTSEARAARPAVDGVSFAVQQGELFVIMGLSGSGKSTVLRMLNRLIDPTAGELTIDGHRLNDIDDKTLREVRNRTINMVFQHFAIFPHRTVMENAAYGLQVRGTSREEREKQARWALERVGLGDCTDSYPAALSGGMRQRVGLARALATDADILLMDEPFSALDPLIRRDMQDLLLNLQSELRKTIVFVTHDLNEAMRLGDRIMVMRDGAIVQLGTGPEILTEPADDYVAEFVSDVDRSRVVTAENVMREPLLTARLDEPPADVLARLENAEALAAFVLDDEGRVLGVARDDRLADGVRAGQSDLDGLLTDEFETVTDSTVLNDVFELVGKHAVPLGVIDESRRLVGVIPRAVLLSALAKRKAPSHA
jgi:glycine betaine/proline transport system ATP-binding protein